MILAVLDARGGLGISGHDVYLNVAGGLKVGEPAADLAAAAALISSFTGRPLPKDTRVFRRNQPFGRCAPGAAGRIAAQGGGQAGLYDGRRAGGHESAKAAALR